MQRYIPTEKDLDQKIRLCEVVVAGGYIARIDERRKVSRRYEVKVLVPEKFTKSDLKRQTPKVLMEHKDYGDFVSMRTFELKGQPKKTDKMVKRREMHSDRELARFAKQRAEQMKDKRNEAAVRRMRTEDGVRIGDTTEYDPRTGLPPLVEPQLDSGHVDEDEGGGQEEQEETVTEVNRVVGKRKR